MKLDLFAKTSLGNKEESAGRLTTSIIDSGNGMNRSVDASETLSTRNSGTIGMRRPRSARVSNERSRSLPRHYTGQYRLSSSTLDLSSAYYDHQKDVLYVTKSVALVLSEPIVSTAEHILFAIHKYINKSDFDVQVITVFCLCIDYIDGIMVKRLVANDYSENCRSWKD